MGAALNIGSTEGEATEFRDMVVGLGQIAVGEVFMQPVIYSPTLDALTPVSAVRVGNVLDTQRRRRDAVPETYVTVPLTG